MGCSRLGRQNSADKYAYPMGSSPTARIRRAIGRIIPQKTARIICAQFSIRVLWPLLQESLCNPMTTLHTGALTTPICRSSLGHKTIGTRDEQREERGSLRNFRPMQSHCVAMGCTVRTVVDWLSDCCAANRRRKETGA